MPLDINICDNITFGKFLKMTTNYYFIYNFHRFLKSSKFPTLTKIAIVLSFPFLMLKLNKTDFLHLIVT